MVKIAVFQNDIGVGGIQKSLVNLLKNLDYSRVSVDLYLCETGNFFQSDFPKELKIHFLPAVASRYKYLPFDWALSRVNLGLAADGPYDLAVDFNSYQPACAIGALTVPADRRVMWIHNNVEIKFHNEWKYRVLWRAFRGKFKYFDAFVPCSNALWEPFSKLSGMKDKAHRVINNYIDVDDIQKKAEEACEEVQPDSGCMNFVALGKLCHQKGYDLMLDCFAGAYKQRKNLRLYILGDGPDRAKLEKQKDELGLADAVFFLGNWKNPYCVMQKMDAFLSTSRYEGQPLNIMEARVIGLPLYCSKNLEAYSDGLQGKEDMLSALIAAKKEEKQPDLLKEYNQKVLDDFLSLADSVPMTFER